MAVKIKLCDITFRPVSFRQTIVRSSVDIILGILPLIGMTIAIIEVTDSQFMLPVLEREKLLDSLDPLPHWLNWISWAWFWSEIFILLTNEKKRALHDYLAGTVVVCTSAGRVYSGSSAP